MKNAIRPLKALSKRVPRKRPNDSFKKEAAVSRRKSARQRFRRISMSCLPDEVPWAAG
jgi:hypothetical protein